MVAPSSFLAIAVCFVGLSDEPPRLTFDQTVDYIAWYNNYVRAGRIRNALDLYSELLDEKSPTGAHLKWPVGEAAKQFEAALGKIWEPQTNVELARFLDSQERFIRIAKKAAMVRDFWHPCPAESPTLIAVIMPELAISRNACKIVLVSAWRKQDKPAQAMLDAWQVVLRSAGQMQQCGLTIGVLVGLAERALVYRDIRAASAAGVLAPQDYAAAVALLEKDDPGAPDFRRAIMVEWATALDLLQYVSPKGKPDVKRWGELVRGVEKAMGSPDFKGQDAAFAALNPHDTAQRIDAYFRELITLTGDSPNRASLHKIMAFEGRNETRLGDNPFMRFVIPSLARSWQLMVRAETERRATILLLGIHQYHAENGKWPGSLDQLKLANLATLRIDLFSDADFKYALIDEMPRLYSFGINEKDDGGNHDGKWGEAGGDHVFWPPPDIKE
ncbi:MAG: hypothetical protein HUU22_18335 [Phycisphaerae bacterium]|nr:hypothetical protein [Phycisphaerae bacterium]NUQ47976.1 hypothetical protein [Phycisphaerae bacterium]